MSNLKVETEATYESRRDEGSYSQVEPNVIEIVDPKVEITDPNIEIVYPNIEIVDPNIEIVDPNIIEIVDPNNEFEKNSREGSVKSYGTVLNIPVDDEAKNEYDSKTESSDETEKKVEKEGDGSQEILNEDTGGWGFWVKIGIALLLVIVIGCGIKYGYQNSEKAIDDSLEIEIDANESDLLQGEKIDDSKDYPEKGSSIRATKAFEDRDRKKIVKGDAFTVDSISKDRKYMKVKNNKKEVFRIKKINLADIESIQSKDKDNVDNKTAKMENIPVENKVYVKKNSTIEQNNKNKYDLTKNGEAHSTEIGKEFPGKTEVIEDNQRNITTDKMIGLSAKKLDEDKFKEGDNGKEGKNIIDLEEVQNEVSEYYSQILGKVEEKSLENTEVTNNISNVHDRKEDEEIDPNAKKFTEDKSNEDHNVKEGENIIDLNEVQNEVSKIETGELAENPTRMDQEDAEKKINSILNNTDEGEKMIQNIVNHEKSFKNFKAILFPYQCALDYRLDEEIVKETNLAPDQINEELKKKIKEEIQKDYKNESLQKKIARGFLFVFLWLLLPFIMLLIISFYPLALVMLCICVFVYAKVKGYNTYFCQDFNNALSKSKVN